MTNEELWERIEQMHLRDYEMRTLGHRVVWDENGKCNVPGIILKHPLAKQLELQRKYY